MLIINNSRLNRFKLNLFLILVSFAANDLIFAQVDEQLLHRFKTEAPESWIKYNELIKRQFEIGRINFVSEYFLNTVDGLKPFQKVTQKISGKERRMVHLINYRKSREELVARNNQYIFSLDKQVDSDWNMIYLNKIDEMEEEQLQQILPPIGADWALDYFPFYFQNRTKWMDLKDLKYINVRRIDFKGRSCVEIEMTFTDPEHQSYKGSPSEPFRVENLLIGPANHHCTVIFSPEEFWLVKSIEGYVLGDPIIDKLPYAFSREYDFVYRGIPYTTKELKYRWSAVENALTVTSKEINNYSTRVSQNDFNISTYGFPEPRWYVPRRSRFVYAIGLVFVFVTAFWVIKFFKNRTN